MLNVKEISKPQVGVIILAGGISSRMNFPKPWLSYNEKRTFLEHIITEYTKFGCKSITVVLNHHFIIDWKDEVTKINKKAVIIENYFPEKGRTYSIQLALKGKQKSDFVFIQNVDNPFVNMQTLQSLYNKRIEDGYVSPEYKGKGGHPILLSISLANSLKDCDSNKSLKEILKGKNRLRVAVEDKAILYNLNTPKEYETHLKIA